MENAEPVAKPEIEALRKRLIEKQDKIKALVEENEVLAVLIDTT